MFSTALYTTLMFYNFATVLGCTELVDWTHLDNTLFRAANTFVSLGSGSGLIQSLAHRLDPLQIHEIPFPPETPRILNREYIFELKFANASISGLRTMNVYPTKVIDSRTLEVGGSMGDLKVNAIDYIVSAQCKRNIPFQPCPVSTLVLHFLVYLKK
jgi:hypothetical protein